MLAGQVAVSTAISIKSRTLRIHPPLSFSRHDRAGWDIVCIHSIAAKTYSRKLVCEIVHSPGPNAPESPGIDVRPSTGWYFGPPQNR